MKRVLIGLGMVLLASLCLAEPKGYYGRSMVVGTTSTMMLPDVQAWDRATNWTAGSNYTAGTYIKVTNSTGFRGLFWASTAGTSSNVAPTWTTNSTIADNSVRWDFVNPWREAFQFIILSTNRMSFSFVNPAVTGKNYTTIGDLFGTLDSGYDDRRAWQGEVYGITLGGTNHVTIHEE